MHNLPSSQRHHKLNACIFYALKDAFALCLRTKGEEDHDLGYELVKRVAQVMMERLQATRLQLLDVYGAPNTRGGL